MSRSRIIFAGTPEFAAVSLRTLVDAGHKPIAVLTQPDRPAGRGKKITVSSVKEYVLQQGIDVLQPVTLRDASVVAELAALEPDLLIVVAYGLLLPQSVLDLPRVACVNVHASLLPRWRGAAPIQAAILAGDTHTGVSLMAMTAGLDCGPVYAIRQLAIGAEETAGALHDRLAMAGGELLNQHLAGLLAGELRAGQQDDAQAMHAPKIRTADALLDWQRPADELARSVRAYNPVPGAYFTLDDERIKCWVARSVAVADVAPGTIVAAGSDGIVVACGSGGLCMQSLQRPGRRPVSAAEFNAQITLLGRRL
ncbi:MAG: methionyl-tRNA formyltransferase [Proteobacteria bacterium]|nr:methionyl-tRNA formyltransferase [Pseudomonadota bacterium]MDA1062951.1 methionyl-tRNA formyltransferase [Pseudomonadota bacterium]